MIDTQRAADPVAAALEELIVPGGLQVVDVGGGSGTHAVPLAVRGCRVTVIDPSIDALAILRRRASDAGVGDRVTGVQADTDALEGAVPAGSADLVLCHHVLESVDDPASAVGALAAALAPGGTLSLIVPGRHAAVLALGIAGRFADATATATSVDGRFGEADPLLRRYDVESMAALLAGAGMEVHSVRGIGVVAPMVPGAVVQSPFQGGAGALAALEAALAATPPLRDIAADLHVLARRRS